MTKTYEGKFINFSHAECYLETTHHLLSFRDLILDQFEGDPDNKMIRIEIEVTPLDKEQEVKEG